MTVNQKPAQEKSPDGVSEGGSSGNWVGTVITKGLLLRGSQAMAWVSGAIMMLLVVLIIVDVVGHNSPLRLPWAAGTYELAELLMSMITAFGLAYCWYREGHVKIEFVLENVKPRPRALLETAAALFALVFVSAIGWRLMVLAIAALQRSEETDFLRIPVGPFMFVFSAAMIHFALVLAASVIKHLRAVFSADNKAPR